MAQSDRFLSDAAYKKEQYHKWLKGRIRASMKLDNNAEYNNSRKKMFGLEGTVSYIKVHIM